MRYIKVSGGTSLCGTDFEEYLKTEMSDEELDKYCAESAQENAEQYEWQIFGWLEDAESYAENNGISIEEAEAEIDEYYAEAYASWTEITEEEYNENNN